MSTVHTIKFVSDLSGEEIPQDQVNVVPFSLDGQDYEIDLSDAEAAQLREALALYVGAARKAKAAAPKRATRPSSGSSDVKEARAWLMANGYPVREKGRIPAEMLEAYRAREAAPASEVTEEAPEAETPEQETDEGLFKAPEAPQEQEATDEPTAEEVIEWHKAQDYKLSLKKDGRPNGLMVTRFKRARNVA